MKRATLAWATLAASIVTSVGQINAVGYASVSIPSGWNLVANPLSAGVTNGADEIMIPMDGEIILTCGCGSHWGRASGNVGEFHRSIGATSRVPEPYWPFSTFQHRHSTGRQDTPRGACRRGVVLEVDGWRLAGVGEAQAKDQIDGQHPPEPSHHAYLIIL